MIDAPSRAARRHAWQGLMIENANARYGRHARIGYTTSYSAEKGHHRGKRKKTIATPRIDTATPIPPNQNAKIQRAFSDILISPDFLTLCFYIPEILQPF